MPGVTELGGVWNRRGVHRPQAADDYLGFAEKTQMCVAGRKGAIRCCPAWKFLDDGTEDWHCFVEAITEKICDANFGNITPSDAISRVQSYRAVFRMFVLMKHLLIAAAATAILVQSASAQTTDQAAAAQAAMEQAVQAMGIKPSSAATDKADAARRLPTRPELRATKTPLRQCLNDLTTSAVAPIIAGIVASGIA
jgi:hypothetical protein